MIVTSYRDRGGSVYSQKLPISLPGSLAQFIEQYKEVHACRSRSKVIEEAVILLRALELEKAYRDAEQEKDTAWEVTVADGLDEDSARQPILYI